MFETRFALPPRSLRQLLSTFVVECQGERSGPIKFNVYTGLFAKFVRKAWKEVARFAAKVEERPALVRLGLRSKHSSRGPRRLHSTGAFFDNLGFSEASLVQLPRDREPDHTTSDDQNVRVHLSIGYMGETDRKSTR